MFWEEDEDKSLPYQAPDDILDVLFTLKCKTLPLDHAWALSEALQAQLPWISDDPQLGIHQIHVAESANGWMRPDDTQGELLYPSRRTKLSLRLHKKRLSDIEALSGQSLTIDGHSLTVGAMKTKALINAGVIFSRHVASEENETENDFLMRMSDEIFQLSTVKIKKMMCGKSHEIQTPNGPLHTRHLMIADLDSEPSISIQQYGLGQYRKLGCGLFLPHKGIKSLKPSE